MYPLLFKPIFVEKNWGSRRLETLYGKALPSSSTIGESLELCDLPDADTTVANGCFQGETLHSLMVRYHDEIMGKAKDGDGYFPITIKMFDTGNDMPVQSSDGMQLVLITHAEPGTRLLIKDGIPVSQGDAILVAPKVPFALSAGAVGFAVQQTRKSPSDKTESKTNSPKLIKSNFSRNSILSSRYLVNEAAFVCDEYRVKKEQHFYITNIVPVIVSVVRGEMNIKSGGETVHLSSGSVCLLPAGTGRIVIETETKVDYLMAQPQAEK